MLTPTKQPITDFRNSFEPPTPFQLRKVRLEIPDERTAVFSARTCGPEGATVWVRAWISNEADGTLAEAEVADIPAGERVTLPVILSKDRIPQLACMRIESEPFATKHTVHVPLLDNDYFPPPCTE